MQIERITAPLAVARIDRHRADNASGASARRFGGHSLDDGAEIVIDAEIVEELPDTGISSSFAAARAYGRSGRAALPRLVDVHA